MAWIAFIMKPLIAGSKILAFTDLSVFVVVHSHCIAVFLICYILINISLQEFLRSPLSSLLL